MSRMIRTNGIDLHVAEAGTGFPVVLCHGFPELGYSWRHQLPALADAGLHAVAPDLRGYGASTKPEGIDAYGLLTLVEDLVGLLDALGFDEAALVGHDWGSIVTWTTALLHPDRVTRMVSLNVPYRGWCAGFPPTETIREELGDRFGYVLMFQEPGVAEAWFDSDPAGNLRALYDGAAAGPFLTEAEFDVYLAAFEDGGISGPINYYRNIDANHAATLHLADAPIAVPVLMVGAGQDPVLPASLIEGMGRWVPDLRTEVIPDAGHWTQQEQPDTVNELLVGFLADLAG